MRIGKTDVDFEAHEIKGPAGQYIIEPKVMEVLSVLVENAGEVVTRDTLVERVWDVEHGGDERLSRAISLLRKALGDTRGRHRYIQTIHKQGYKLNIKIEEKQGIGSQVSYSVPPRKLGLKDVSIFAAVLFFLASALFLGKEAIFPTSAEPPLVIIMDSAHPARVYDEHIIAEGATNADILSDILADLDIQTQKELISPNWHRYEAIKKFDPDLIVIHYSGFKQEDASGDRPQLRLLIEYFQNSDTEFLIYSRAGYEWLNGNMDIILEGLYKQNPSLKDRIDVFPLLEYGEPYWADQKTSQAMKLKIKTILEAN